MNHRLDRVTFLAIIKWHRPASERRLKDTFLSGFSISTRRVSITPLGMFYRSNVRKKCLYRFLAANFRREKKRDRRKKVNLDEARQTDRQRPDLT